MIAIIDYGVGNLFSLASSLKSLGLETKVTRDAAAIRAADHIILPGVGAFADAMAKLEATGLVPVIKQEVEHKPLLGICLGMQLLFEKSYEYGEHTGLGLIPGEVCPLADDLKDPSLKVPHIGWNRLDIVPGRENDPLFKYTKPGEYVYYVHSFYAKNCAANTLAASEYSIPVTGAVKNGLVYGTQFHPEKSGDTGLRILRAFAELRGAAMKLYPAIDLRGGQAVRLYQGDYDQMTVYNADPAAQAREFIAAGAKYLHVVDLDGAKDDTTANMTTIAAIAKQGGLFIEVGGGIRDEARIEQYLSLGVGRCILGTIAVKDFDFTARMAQKYGPKIAVGVDMRDGLVAVNGWKEVTPEPGVAFCRRCAEAGVQAIIATDISRDGTMQGTNMDLYRELLQISGLEITASGGIARMEELAELQAMGCHAAILGKSIYTGAIDLKQAVALYQE